MTPVKIIIALIVLGIVAWGLTFFAVDRNNANDGGTPEPTTFAECARRYPVMESSPRQCVTPDGARFVEEVARPSSPAPSSPPQGQAASGIPNLISVAEPTVGQRIVSPVVLTGSARGTWYFEASFPIDIIDARGNVIGRGHGEAQSDWMTENFVPFRASVSFTPQPAGSSGTVILRKDNPSGDPSRDQSVSIPVTF